MLSSFLLFLLLVLACCIIGRSFPTREIPTTKSTTHSRRSIPFSVLLFGRQEEEEETWRATKSTPWVSSDDDNETLSSIKKKHSFGLTRRQACISALVVGGATATAPPFANAAGLFAAQPERQLELCIISLIRIAYWAEKTGLALLQSDNIEVRKQRYLEARLACKALVTGKVGGGATYTVFTLNSLGFKECLKDLVLYADQTGVKGDRRKVAELQTDLIESLASVVEFDGLENTIESSGPRSSLTLSQYTESKATFVRRTLLEKVVPSVNALIRPFGDKVEGFCRDYVAKTYASELPGRLLPPPQPTQPTPQQ